MAQPLYYALFSSAEVSLYLAELSLLGAQLPVGVEDYFKQGIESSLRLYDRLAMLNKTPYYSPNDGFDPLDETIALKPDEITPGTNVVRILADEWLYYDLNAPAFGEGNK